mgnify:CR=1 FL=1
MTASPHVERLIAEMTLAEKAGQLTLLSADLAVTGPTVSADYLERVRSGGVGSLFNLHGRERIAAVQRVAVEETRLGIPLLFGLDVLHGHRTIFPIPLGETATFDPALWRRTARAAAREATADGVDLTFAPMLDVARDPRWGRIAESFGEDPVVGRRFAAEKVAGFQGPRPDAPDALAACAKHIGAYGAVLAGRDYAMVDVSDRLLDEVYLPPFEAAVAAGALAIMPSFNDLAGIPATAHAALLAGRVRGRWGFSGLFVSDYGAVAELVVHGVAADLAEAAALALRAGVDFDMMGDAYVRGLAGALDRGLSTMDEVDAAVRRVLSAKERLGLFADPCRRTRTILPDEEIATNRAIAREAAARSMVLLSDPAGILPVGPAVRRIAVIGPLGDAADEMVGPWWAAYRDGDAVSPLVGLRLAFPDREIVFAEGVANDGEDASGIPAAVAAAADADLVVLCLGESRWSSGEAASRATLALPGRQEELARAILATGRPVLLVLFVGRPFAIAPLIEGAAATLVAWFPGSEGGNALADVLAGRVAPEGRLPVSWPAHVGQVPVFFGRRRGGRPPAASNRYTSKYVDCPTEPLFPFGHGLTGTAFEIRALRVRPDRVPLDALSEVAVEVDVVNVGARAGTEAVFLFVHDRVASVARPELEFRDVARIRLAPGERGTVRFALAPADLAFPAGDGSPVIEPGRFEILVGPSADRAGLVAGTLDVGPPAATA